MFKIVWIYDCIHIESSIDGIYGNDTVGNF